MDSSCSTRCGGCGEDTRFLHHVSRVSSHLDLLARLQDPVDAVHQAVLVVFEAQLDQFVFHLAWTDKLELFARSFWIPDPRARHAIIFLIEVIFALACVQVLFLIAQGLHGLLHSWRVKVQVNQADLTGPSQLTNVIVHLDWRSTSSVPPTLAKIRHLAVILLNLLLEEKG